MKYIYNSVLIILVVLVHIGCGNKDTKEESSTPAAPPQSGILTPVKWSFTVNKISDTEAELIMKASIDNGWHLYSMNQETGNGEISGPTSLTLALDKSSNYSPEGEINESSPLQAKDPVFEMNVKFFEHEAVYKQKIQLLTKEAFNVTGRLNFQSCNDKMCIPSTDEEFQFEIPG